VNLVFASDLPLDVRGSYAHYNHRRVGIRGWQYCDIRTIINRNQDRWLDEMDAWHKELSSKASSLSPWWWLLPGSRLTAWYPADLKPLFFALAVIEQCKTMTGQTLYVIGCPDEVLEHLREWSQSGGLSLVIETCASSGYIPTSYNHVRAALRLPGQHAKSIKSILSLLIRVLASHKLRGQRAKRAKVIVFSYALSARSMTESGDHYFGNVLDGLPGLRNDDILWLYDLGPFSERRTIRRHMYSVGRKFHSYLALLTLSDMVRILKTCIHLQASLKSLRYQLPVLCIGQLQSRIFPRRFYGNFIRRQLPAFELAAYYSVRRVLRDSQATTLLYPYEEKGTERAILRACKEHESNVRTVGFAHAAYNKGHLYLRNHGTVDVDPPGPDRIAATGPAAREWLIKWAGIDPQRIVVVGSPRFPHFIPPSPLREDSASPMRVLFLGGYGHELNMMANFVEEVPDLFEHCELLVRPYPYGWQAQQDQGIVRLRQLLRNVRVEDSPLDEQIRWCRVVLFGSTSAGIHAMLRGRLSIQAALHDIFEADPTQGKGDHSGLELCSTPLELKKALDRVRLMSREGYLHTSQQQSRFASRIYGPVCRSRISQLLS